VVVIVVVSALPPLFLLPCLVSAVRSHGPPATYEELLWIAVVTLFISLPVAYVMRRGLWAR
jgi:hypothetical protein